MLADLGDSIQGIIVLTVLGGGLFWQAIKRHKRVRHIQDTPRSKIESAPQGLVELEGFAWPKENTVKTISDEEAIYYHLSLQREETRGSGKKKRKEWVTVGGFSYNPEFYILDPTGLALIDPKQKMERELSDPFIKDYGRLTEAQKQAVQNMVGHVSGFPPTKILFGLLEIGRYRIVETKILLGSPIYAMGDFTSIPDGHVVIDGALQSFRQKVINIDGRAIKNVSAQMPKERNGLISSRSARAGYAAAAKVSRANPDQNAEALTVFGLLSSSESHSLFIADQHEHHLVAHLSSSNGLRFVGGAAMLAGALVWSAVGIFGAKLESRPIESNRTSAEAVEHVQADTLTEYHQRCVSGQALYCRLLLRQKEKYKLNDTYVSYYAKRACEIEGNCDRKNIHRASSATHSSESGSF